MLKKSKSTHLRSRRVDLPKPVCYPLDVFFFRIEFTQVLDPYEHAQCVDTFKWKCLLLRHLTRWALKCSILVYKDGIDQKKWVCCNKCKNTYHLECVTCKKEENIKFPFLCMFNEYRNGRNVKQVVKRVIFSFLVARQKTIQKKVCHGKDSRKIAAESHYLQEKSQGATVVSS